MIGSDLSAPRACAPWPSQMGIPFVTVVIPALNEERYIEHTIQGILNQDYQSDRYEIVIADGGSTDQTIPLIHGMQVQYPQIKLHANPGRSSSAGRNVGFRAGQGDIFIVVDAHCHIDSPDLFRNMVETFERTGAYALGRPQPLIPVSDGVLARSICLARGSILGHSARSYIYSDAAGGAVSIHSTGAMYRREVFQEIGYVDESFDACEDVEFNYRVEAAGLKTYFDPRLVVYYYARQHIQGLFWQMFRYGLGRYRLILKHSKAASLETFIPMGLVGMAVLLPFGSILPELLAAMMLAIFGGYLMLLLGVSIWVGIRNRSWKVGAILPMVFAAIHYGLGAGFWSGMIGREGDG